MNLPDYFLPGPGDDSCLPWKYSKWFAMSSLSFMIPACTLLYFAQRPEYVVLALTYASVSLVSANYWRQASRGMRRNADLIMAKLSVVFILVIGIVYISNFQLQLAIYAFALFIGSLYALSSYLHDIAKSRYWIPAHLFMHGVVLFGMSVVALGAISQPAYP